MKSPSFPLLPKYERLLANTGEQIKLARLRRKLSSRQVAERAGLSRPTVSSLEKGSASVSLGALLKVLIVLGLENDLLKLGHDDELGRKLQDLDLQPGERAPKKPEK